jgi:hypothetical protein
MEGQHMHRTVTVNDSFQQGYTYSCIAEPGQDFRPDFTPDLTPQQMLSLGVFGGKYLNDCHDEFPSNWFRNARVTHGAKDILCNYFEIDASQPLRVWREKGWIYEDDPRGWFQWYCRYYMGRRIEHEDDRQIKRWRAMRRHVAQVQKYCQPGDLACRRKQRQALLHWAYDSRKL